MKSNWAKEDVTEKKKYVFFSDPDIIAQRAEASAAAAQVETHHQAEDKPSEFNIKGSDKILSCHLVQPYPFTFLSAVKRKLTSDGPSESYKKSHDSPKPKNDPTVTNIQLNEIIQKMDLIKPLKVPDSKISKKLDYSRENSASKELINPSKDFERTEKPSKNFERVQRRLDFSTSDVSSPNNSEIEPLKVPNISISSHLSKKKEYIREKENRSKKIRKDDGKQEEAQEIFKRSRSPRHSRKELNPEFSKLKDRLFNVRESEFGSKPKNFATSTSKKATEKKRSLNKCLKLRDTSLESKNRSYSNESLSSKLSDKITIREPRNIVESFDYLMSEKQHKPLQNAGNIFKETKKVKPSTSKIDGKVHILSSKETETDSSPTVSQKSKDSEKMQSGSKSGKTEDSKYTDDSLTQSGVIKKEEEEDSYTETKQTNESNLNDSSLSSALLDPRRISFRDESRSPQEEFCDLVTPDVNLMSRSKRKRQFVQGNVEEAKCLKHGGGKGDAEQEAVPLLHPTALHMQFQAELHLLDSFNESLRQVMDVEKCLYNAKQEQEKELPQHPSKGVEERIDIDDMKHRNEISKLHKHSTTEQGFPSHHITSQTMATELENLNKIVKPTMKAVEVQTQTVNDMATQTDILPTRRNVQSRCSEVCGVPYERGFIGDSEVPQLSLDSVEQFEDLDQIEEISLPSKLRTMSEISLHETTSSIRTETGTEISISTRDVTCSFNKYLDLEIAQLIKDEKQRYDKIEMLFKSREKTLNDRTKKLVKLEEQKRALRDTGQESRVSSVKKKQRALLLKLQQEKDEMNRLKELHKIASQERKLMLQKQRNMFNPQMSTKNILTKLKRSADSQSPRRLSGPMKGYDIRSNSSMSSLVDSDKSQHDRSQPDARLQMSESELILSKSSLDLPKDKFVNLIEGKPFDRSDKSDEVSKASPQEKCPYKRDGKSKYEIRSRKFEEKMPNIRLKSHELISNHSITGRYIFEKEKSESLDKSEVKSESDTLVEELSKKSKDHQTSLREIKPCIEILEEVSSSQDTKTSKSSQVAEDILQAKSLKKKSDKEEKLKKAQYTSESKSNLKRRNSKCQKNKSSVLTENILRSKSEELKHPKRTKTEFSQFDKNDEEKHAKSSKLMNRVEDFDSKENVSCQMFESVEGLDHFDDTKSQISNFAVSHRSSESDRNYSRSVVIRSQEQNLKTSKKLEQILNAREAALTSRKNCVEEWMAWHAKLRTEEDRVARMEQAALKLVTATSNVFSQQDTTVSSDTSDIEGRIELLTEKLAERRVEMSRLKREARKQTKQKLRALEANLLNQIKKYDTTIHEMRKKLESKRTTSKDNRLAIESRSLADFKVPEIPIKRIQDIFKSSDILRSRSESDLSSSKKPSINDTSKKSQIPTRIADTVESEEKSITNSEKLQSLKNLKSLEIEDNINRSERLIKPIRNLKEFSETEDNYSEKPENLRISSKNIRPSEQLIGQSVFDDGRISQQIKIDNNIGSMSTISNDINLKRGISYDIKQNKQGSRRNKIPDDVRSEISDISEDILSQSEIKSSKRESPKGSVISDIRTEISGDILTQSEIKSSKRENLSKSGISDVRTEISEEIVTQTEISEDRAQTEAKSSKREKTISEDFRSEICEDIRSHREIIKGILSDAEISEEILTQTDTKSSNRENMKKTTAEDVQLKMSEDILSPAEIPSRKESKFSEKTRRNISEIGNSEISEDILSHTEISEDILSQTETRSSKGENVKSETGNIRTEITEDILSDTGSKYSTRENAKRSGIFKSQISQAEDKFSKPCVNSRRNASKIGTEISEDIPSETEDIVTEAKSIENQIDTKDIKFSKRDDIQVELNKYDQSNLKESNLKVGESDLNIQIEYKSDFDTISEETVPKISSVNKVQISSSRVYDNHSSNLSDEIVKESRNESLDKKLDFLRMNNQNLNEDISSLENELKILSEMMSRFNKQNEVEERSTSKDVSEVLSISDKHETEGIELSLKDTEIPQDDETLKPSLNGNKRSKTPVEQVENVIPNLTPTKICLIRSKRSRHQEIDYEARSKEILNEIEKSIISERINDSETVDVPELLNLHEEDQINEPTETSEVSSKSVRSRERVPEESIINSLGPDRNSSEKSRLVQGDGDQSDSRDEDNDLVKTLSATENGRIEDSESELLLRKKSLTSEKSNLLGTEDQSDLHNEDNNLVKCSLIIETDRIESISRESAEYMNELFSREKSVASEKSILLETGDLSDLQNENRSVGDENVKTGFELVLEEPQERDTFMETEVEKSKEISQRSDEHSRVESEENTSDSKLFEDNFEKTDKRNLINVTFDKSDHFNKSESFDIQNISFFQDSHIEDSMNKSKNESKKFLEGSLALTKLNESVEETEEILNAIAKEGKEEEEDIEYSIESDDFQKVIHESVTKILDKVERSIEEGLLIEKLVNRNKSELTATFDEERRKSFSPMVDEETSKRNTLSQNTEEEGVEEITSEEDLASHRIHTTKVGVDVNLSNSEILVEDEANNSSREKLIDQMKKKLKTEEEIKSRPTLQEKTLQEFLITEEISTEEVLSSNKSLNTQSSIDRSLEILDKVAESIKEDSSKGKFIDQMKKKLKTEERKSSPTIQNKSLEEEDDVSIEDINRGLKFDEENNEETSLKGELRNLKTKDKISEEKSLQENITISEISSIDVEEELSSNKSLSQSSVNKDVEISDKVEKNIEETSLRDKFLGQSKDRLKTEEEIKSSSIIQEKSTDLLTTEETSKIREESNITKLHQAKLARKLSKSEGIIITELEPGTLETDSLPELEIDGKIELAEEIPDLNETNKVTKIDVIEEISDLNETNEINKIPLIEEVPDLNETNEVNKIELIEEAKKSRQVDPEGRIIKEQLLEPILELDSSDGEQLDNLIEVAEGRLEIIEKSKDSLDLTDSESLSHDKTESEITSSKENKTVDVIRETPTESIDKIKHKTFDIIKDPEYEDISEESLEVSEIFDKSEDQKRQKGSLIERYEAIQKSEEVLKILDEITQRNRRDSENRADSDKSVGDNEEDISRSEKSKTVTPENHVEFDERQDALSESSEGRDTPRGVSEIEMDSPREVNDSRLDIDMLNDDLLSSNGDKQVEAKETFHAGPIATTERDIEVMIDKLKASLEQPRVEDADWEAKLLRIEQLQIELEIKKLEAEEVSYYVREIPNKPPPPYTPPGGTRISTSLGSPSPPPAVIPSNTEELTAFTEKATAIIFRAKEAGEDIMTLEAPAEICELTKENDETVKKDRRVYNAFLFDLCKETIAEVYQAEYEKPGPSWTKPNVKTKPTMKMPKTIDELNAYVNKEVATLFGFKTKLQRENMVMRWSRKRRDRVDELLAREAQAEEDEWTKFHHDELAVKNGLTVTILDTLLMETVNVVKVAYAKKRKIFV